jgi:hypothetical protein
MLKTQRKLIPESMLQVRRPNKECGTAQQLQDQAPIIEEEEERN